MMGPPPGPGPLVGQPVASPQATELDIPFVVDLRRRILDGEAGEKYDELDKLWNEIINVANVAAQKELIRETMEQDSLEVQSRSTREEPGLPTSSTAATFNGVSGLPVFPGTETRWRIYTIFDVRIGRPRTGRLVRLHH